VKKKIVNRGMAKKRSAQKAEISSPDEDDEIRTLVIAGIKIQDRMMDMEDELLCRSNHLLQVISKMFKEWIFFICHCKVWEPDLSYFPNNLTKEINVRRLPLYKQRSSVCRSLQSFNSAISHPNVPILCCHSL
jgi:hypothetical protein